jgi:hypothetical protein
MFLKRERFTVPFAEILFSHWSWWILSWAVALEISAGRRSDKPVISGPERSPTVRDFKRII